MTPRGKSALLWGVVGGLAFAVLAQGAVLLGQRLPVDALGTLALGVGVGVVAGASAYVLEPRLG